MGRLLRDTGQYDAAIELLRDPLLRERDPDGYLSALRIRADVFDRLGDVSPAAADLHIAASLPDNYAPEEDYKALASMYKQRARAESDPEARREWQQLAIQEWQRALNLFGLDRGERRAIMSQIDAETSLLAASANDGQVGEMSSVTGDVAGTSALTANAASGNWRPSQPPVRHDAAKTAGQTP